MWDTERVNIVLGVQTIKKNSENPRCKTHTTYTHMRSTQDRRTHADTLTVWWWITLTSCTNAEQPVWAHWSISEHSCYTAQRQHNNTTKTVSLGTQTHSLAHNTYTRTHARTHTHTHTHTHIFTLGHARTGLSNRWNEIICWASEDGVLWEQSRSDVWLQYNSIMRLKLPANRYYKLVDLWISAFSI